MDGTMKPVMKIVTENDVVFCVWQDTDEPYGVGILTVKGANRMREIVATGEGQTVRLAAITCNEFEQAEALRMTFLSRGHTTDDRVN